MKTASELCAHVCEANREIGRSGLAALTWGNASGIDRERGWVAIKPSGVEYCDLTPEHIVVLELGSGERVDGDLKPSSDTPTHLLLYRSFPTVGGIVHTHSHYATVWAQAGMEIPCMGTTHADSFYGPVPITRDLAESEISGDYEVNTDRVIEERFNTGDVAPDTFPGVLVPGHGAFAWGSSAADAVRNGMILEEVARLAFDTRLLNKGVKPISRCLLDRHYLRKHGEKSYYGQG